MVCDGVDNDGGEIDEDFDANFNGIPDCDETERCDCIDNDGDGEIDEDYYRLGFVGAADQSYTVFFDGDAVVAAAGPPATEAVVWRRPRDLGPATGGSAPAAASSAPPWGTTVSVTGDGTFAAEGHRGLHPDLPHRAGRDPPWVSGAVLPASGAEWIVPRVQRSAGPGVWFVKILVCGRSIAVSEADGIDNDGIAIDEGFFDGNADGVADCFDVEDACSGLDDDGDNYIDEGFEDADADGIADCIDEEVCNGSDDDGNGIVDDGFADTDGDGVADCVDEEVDGLDNDGDGFVDESAPTWTATASPTAPRMARRSRPGSVRLPRSELLTVLYVLLPAAAPT